LFFLLLIYNGEIIIAESCKRYIIIKEYLEEFIIFFIIDDYKENNRWFIVHGIKYKLNDFTQLFSIINKQEYIFLFI
jgi:hypothetical protein